MNHYCPILAIVLVQVGVQVAWAQSDAVPFGATPTLFSSPMARGIQGDAIIERYRDFTCTKHGTGLLPGKDGLFHCNRCIAEAAHEDCPHVAWFLSTDGNYYCMDCILESNPQQYCPKHQIYFTPNAAGENAGRDHKCAECLTEFANATCHVMFDGWLDAARSYAREEPIRWKHFPRKECPKHQTEFTDACLNCYADHLKSLTWAQRHPGLTAWSAAADPTSIAFIDETAPREERDRAAVIIFSAIALTLVGFWIWAPRRDAATFTM